ncbi:MAG: hypothetical protein KF764_05940 [Labilithrix sp.]|nr:hypothetical protein [Labilithrix sp.]
MFGLVGCGSLAGAGCAATEARQGFDTAATDPSGGDGDDVGDGSGGGGTPAKPDQPGCAQDAYTETLPTQASLSGLTFSSAKANDYLLSALERRFPLGKAIVEGGLTSSLAKTQGNCIDRFLSDKSSAAAVLRQATTVVHECGHFYDLGEASGGDAAYVIRPDELSFTCKSGDTTSRGGKTFARSLIRKDAHYAKRKACATGTAGQGCDMYASIYLDGSPTDAKFDSGDQGYSFVLEEAAQYVNSLATALAFQESYSGTKASERDGILTFLWYIERYLAMARTDYPAAYELLSEDPCWRQATLSVWDRGWFYLRATEGLSNLGIEDSKIEPLVNDPELTAEIDALRKLECK